MERLGNNKFAWIDGCICLDNILDGASTKPAVDFPSCATDYACKSGTSDELHLSADGGCHILPSNLAVQLVKSGIIPPKTHTGSNMPAESSLCNTFKHFQNLTCSRMRTREQQMPEKRLKHPISSNPLLPFLFQRFHRTLGR